MQILGPTPDLLDQKLQQPVLTNSPTDSGAHSNLRTTDLGLACMTLCDPMDYSLPGSSIHRILQARILEWVAMPSSRGSS